MTPMRPEDAPITPKALAEGLLALLEQQVPSAHAALTLHAHHDELAATIQEHLESLRPEDIATLALSLVEADKLDAALRTAAEKGHNGHEG